MMGCVLIPLNWVRKIEPLANTHVFGDLMILITVVTIWVYAFIRLEKYDFQAVPALKENTFLDAIGSMIFSFEGIGCILPIYEAARDKEKMPSIIFYVLTTLLVLYFSFGYLLMFIYGDALAHTNLITETITSLEPVGTVDWLILVIKVLFTL